MTVVTTPNVHPESAADTDGQSINLYELGMLFVVRCRYWTCRAGNDADDLELSADRIDAKAIASFGSKDLLDPEKTRKRFAHLEKRARHVLEKHSRPFAAANAASICCLHSAKPLMLISRYGLRPFATGRRPLLAALVGVRPAALARR